MLLFLVSSLLICLISAVGLRLVGPHPLVWIILVNGGIFVAMVTALIRSGRIKAVSWAYLSFTYFCILSGSGLNGGVFNPSAMYLGLIPLMATAMIGVRAGVVFTVLSVISFGAMAALDPWIQLLPVGEWMHSPISVGANLATMAVYVLGMSWFVDSVWREQLALLEGERRRAEEASSAKSRFLANMSHELRTPLNGLLGLTDLVLMDQDLPEESAEQLRVATRSGRGLVVLLDELLDLSRVEAGKLVIEATPFSPAEELASTCALFSAACHERGLELEWHLDPGAEAWALGDPLRLRQVLGNLLSNAVKFTHEGSIRIHGERSGDTLRFTVRDTGVGVEAEKLEKLFEPFTQADSSTTRRYGGSGLGLAIVDRMVGLMGGEIDVESTPGVGSTFSFSIEAPPCDPPAQEVKEDSAEEEGLRILLAEDHPVNQLMLQRLLERLGHSVALVSNGQQAVQAAQRERFDLVLMDCHMPEMDGLEATRELRRLGQTVPIVAVTASVLPEEEEAAREAGMDDLLGKPVEPTQLRAVLRRHRRAS